MNKSIPSKPKCFIICPIGDPGSSIREHADTLLEYILKPILQDDYQIIRSDTMNTPGMISLQIIENIYDSDLVIADLTNHNPNVYYELAVRHAVNKPYIQLIHKDQQLPFDLKDIRTIQYDFHVKHVDDAKKKLKELLNNVGKLGEMANPISTAINFKALKPSENPIAYVIPQIMQTLSSIQYDLSYLKEKLNEKDTHKVISTHQHRFINDQRLSQPSSNTWEVKDSTPVYYITDSEKSS